MKVIHIDARVEVDITKIIKKVKYEGTLGLVTTIQLVGELKKIQKLLPNSLIGGQVLGCNAALAKRLQNKVDAYLYIGSGEFHPLEIALETNKPVIWANPFTNEIKMLSEEDVKKRKKRIKGAYLKYLNAEKVGILVSNKNGQNLLGVALRFQKKTKKTSYIFFFNTLDINGLENFPDIDCWINTACSRIAIEDYDKFTKPIINALDIEKMEHGYYN